MNSASSNPGVPTWKTSTKKSEKTSAGKRPWQQASKLDQSTPRKPSNLFGIVIGLLLLFIGFAIIFYLLTWLRPAKGTSVLLIGCGYEENISLPHNIFGRRGLEDFEKLAQSGGWDVQRKTIPLEKIDNWDKGLNSARESTVVIFMSLHGGADDNGAFLFPESVGLPTEPGSDVPQQSRLYMNTVLKRLAKIPENQHVLLLLDTTRIHSAPFHGMMSNQFVRGLDELNDRISEIPNLVVLCASDVDQQSWVSPELGRSIFIDTFLKGIQGKANTNGDNRLTVQELHHYISNKVQTWTAANRDALQTPVLYPRGEQGLTRAAKMDLNVIYSSTEEVAPAEKEDIPNELVEAWKEAQELVTTTPHPATYSPARWRLFNEYLLRYEQLMLAGETDSAANMRRKWKEVGEDIRSFHQVPLTFSKNTSLALHSIISPISAKENDTRKDAFQSLWKAKEKEREKLWKDIKKQSPDPKELAFDFTGLLFDQVSHDPAQLGKARALLRLLEGDSGIRPVEVHVMTMLEKHLPWLNQEPSSTANSPKKLPPGLPLPYVRKVMQVRKQAEQVAWGVLPGGKAKSAGLVEKIYPWVRKAVTDLDSKRRLAEDHFFSSQPSDWEEGNRMLLALEEQYHLLATRVDTVQKVHVVRAKLWSQLPYLANWVALRALHSPQDAESKHRELANKIMNVAATCHEVEKLLSKVSMDSLVKMNPPTQAQWDMLIKVSKKMEETYSEIENRATQYFAKIELATTPKALLENSDLASLPVWNGEARRQLISNQQEIRTQLMQRKLEPLPVSVQLSNRRHRESSELLTHMALELLGKRIYESCRKDGGTTFEQLEFQLGVMALQTQWWKTVQGIATELAHCQQRLPKLANTTVTQSGPQDLNQQLHLLLLYGSMARHMDAPSAQLLNSYPNRNISRFQYESLLLWQCQRSYLDFWAADAVGIPYYQEVGNAFLEDAKQLIKRSPSLTSFADSVNLQRTILLEKRGFEIQLSDAPGLIPGEHPDHYPLTSENSVPLQFLMSDPDTAEQVPPGKPVIWMNPGSDVSLLPYPKSEVQGITKTLPSSILFSTADNRKLIPRTDTSKKVYLRTRLKRLWNPDPKSSAHYPTTKSTPIQVGGLFRGHNLNLTKPLDIVMYSMPNVTHSKHPLPLMANLAVQADEKLHEKYGTAAGSVAIVLDASGSMRPAKGESWKDSAKYVQATTALKEVFHSIPNGTKVSLWVFGRAVGPQKTTPEAEQSVRQILKPTVWDPRDEDKIAEVMKAITYPTLEPWNETPLFHTMMQAATDLNDSKGYKSVIVITDGIDNRIAKDKQYNPDSLPTEEFLKSKRFRDWFKGIQINIIGFRIVSEEQEIASKHFKILSQLTPPGHYFLINDAEALVKSIRSAMFRKLRYWVDWSDNRPVPGDLSGGLDVSIAGLTEQWIPGGLPPGNYKLRMKIPNVPHQAIALNQADLLFLELYQRKESSPPGQLNFRRVIYSKMDRYPPSKIWEQNGWITGVVQNRMTTSGQAQMLVTLEKANNEKDSVLQHSRPRFVWLEVDTKEPKTTPYQINWYFQPGFPAPAWSVTSPKWPTEIVPGLGQLKGSTPAKPRIRMWWSPFQEVSGFRLERGHQFNNITDLVNEQIQLGNDNYVLESVRVENHPVQTSSPKYGKPPQQKQHNCLVIRMRYPKGKPVIVDLKLPGLGGSEHHYYSSANKYTGIFWPVTPRQVNEVLREIRIIPLSLVKANAERDNYYAEIDDLSSPMPGELRLQMPVDLSKIPIRLLDKTTPLPNIGIPELVPILDPPR